MDKEEIQNLIVNRVKNLQPEIQAILLGDDYVQKLQSICDIYKLTPEQATALELNTTLVLIGDTHPNEYIAELTKDLKLAPVVIKQIADDVNSQILKNILGMIKQNFIDDELAEKAVEREGKTGLNPQFASLPQNLQDAIANSDYQKKLYDIATKYKLQIENMGKLEEVTVRLITGSISPSQYENILGLELGIEASKAHDIATDVNAQILLSIRENMKTQTATRQENISTQADAVPVPPYASAKSFSDTKYAIKPVIKAPEVIETTPIVTPKVEIKPEVAPVEKIEFSNTGIDAMKEKLDGLTTSKEIVSDQTLPKAGIGAINHDPYHEPIE